MEPRDFPGPICPVPITPGPNLRALWQLTNPRIAARFPSFSTRKQSTGDEARRVSLCIPSVSRDHPRMRSSSSAHAGVASRKAAATASGRCRRPGILSPPPLRLLVASAHANGEPSSAYISMPPARVLGFLILSSHRLFLVDPRATAGSISSSRPLLRDCPRLAALPRPKIW